MNRWFRFYTGVVDDPKAQMLAPEMFKHWVNVLCIAAQNDGELPAISATAFTLRLSEPKAAGILAKLHAAGLLDKTAKSFKPHNWDGRQYKHDQADATNADRQKRYRERHRNDTSNGDSNAVTTVTAKRPETEQKQTTEQNRAEPRDELKIRTGNFQQAIVQAFAGANSPNLPETSRAGLWLSQGYQEDICLAVIAELVRKKPSITTLNYFDNAIREAHAAKAPPRQAVAMDAAEINWDRVLTDFKKFGRWSKWAGPDLESPACRAPADMLQKHGLAKIHDAPPIPIPKTMMGNA